jgi:hypothetical protein
MIESITKAHIYRVCGHQMNVICIQGADNLVPYILHDQLLPPDNT